MEKVIVGIIDVQRGFIPAEEGEKLDRAGFGELAVPEGEKVINPVRALIRAAGSGNVFTTQDWHPEGTAHFDENPNFVTNWPVHCVKGSQGAMLHPRVESALMPSATRFKKGQEVLERGEDDLSYSGYYGTNEKGQTLPEWLKQRGAEVVILGGLALDYCVGKTALDLRTKLGLDVRVALDATRGIAEGSVKQMLEDFEETGVKTITTDQAVEMLEATR